MLARVSLWVALLSTAALLLSPASCAEDAARIEVVGTLIKPPCTANFPASRAMVLLTAAHCAPHSTGWG